jgi:hypothetical protein
MAAATTIFVQVVSEIDETKFERAAASPLSESGRIL